MRRFLLALGLAALLTPSPALAQGVGQGVFPTLVDFFDGNFRGRNISDRHDDLLTVESNVEFLGTIIPDPAFVPPPHVEGQLWYDVDNKTWTYDTNIVGVRIQISQEGTIRVKNTSGALIPDARPVYLNGAAGQRPTIACAQADSLATSRLVALTTHDCADTATCIVTIWGEVRGIDSDGSPFGEVWTEGIEIFVSAATPCGITKTMPASPNFTVVIGLVSFVHSTEGKLHVSIQRDPGVPDPIVPADGVQDITGSLELTDGTLIIAGADPVLSACGTTPAVAGGDGSGRVTVGTGVTTSCTATFAAAFANPPACIVTGDQASTTYAASATTTVLTITSSADMDSDVLSFFCVGL